MGWGLTVCLWLGPRCFNCWFSFTLSHSRISHEYSSLFIIVMNLIFLCFRFDALTEYMNRIFMFFCIKSYIRTQGEVGFILLIVLRRWFRCCLTLCCFVFYSTRRYVLCLALCYFVFFSPFSLAITSLGEELELVLVLFVRLFDLRLFGFACFLFLLVSGKGCGL